MKKKNIALIIILILALSVGAYFAYKAYMANCYKYSYIDEIDIKLGDTWKIEYETLKDKDYFKLGEIQIKNEFKNFKKNENTNTYTLKDKDGTTKAGIGYFKYVTYTEGFTTNLVIYESGEKAEKAIEEFMNEHKFKDDVEFLKYLLDYRPKKLNLFASTKEIKDNYAASFLKNSILVDGIVHVIDGKYVGYVIEDEGKYEANIIDENTKHIITFTNKDYFSKDKVIELLSSLKLS